MSLRHYYHNSYSQTLNRRETLDTSSSPACQPSPILSASSLPRPMSTNSGEFTITKKTFDCIINAIISSEERAVYESKLFLPLHDLIFFSNSPKRVSDFPYYQNGFVIFRKDYQARLAVRKYNTKENCRDASRNVKLLWKNATPEDKRMYQQLLSCNHKFHDILWSNHIFRSSRNLKCNYEYSDNKTIISYSPSFFTPIPPLNQEYMENNRFSFTYPIHLTLDPPIALTDSLFSYDKSLIESINKEINL
ncbi:2451_t:CDS:1, partial [Acaulospora morrowiae]